jgi:hypothetical protein
MPVILQGVTFSGHSVGRNFLAVSSFARLGLQRQQLARQLPLNCRGASGCFGRVAASVNAQGLSSKTRRKTLERALAFA